MLCLQGRASAGARPDPGDKRESSGAGDQPAAGPEPPAAAWTHGGAGSGQGQHIVITARHAHHDGKNHADLIPKLNGSVL